MWTLGARGGVASVAGIDPGVIVKDVEDPGLDIAHQRGQSLRVCLDVADTAGERVACPDVSVAAHIVVGQAIDRGVCPRR